MLEMVLRYTAFSPFSRKVLLLAMERDLMPRLTLVATEVGTHVPLVTIAHDELAVHAPLMKVPVLITEEGNSLYDSRVICEYLDTLHRDSPVFPQERPLRWKTLQTQSLADGIIEACLLCRFEASRENSKQSSEWTTAQLRRVSQGLDLLNKDCSVLHAPLNIGAISVACALGYLDFRFSHLNWRNGRSVLAAWFSEFSQRTSMQATDPSAFRTI